MCVYKICIKIQACKKLEVLLAIYFILFDRKQIHHIYYCPFLTSMQVMHMGCASCGPALGTSHFSHSTMGCFGRAACWILILPSLLTNPLFQMSYSNAIAACVTKSEYLFNSFFLDIFIIHNDRSLLSFGWACTLLL